MSLSLPDASGKAETSSRQVRVSYRPMRKPRILSAERQEPLVETENRERLEVEARNVLLGQLSAKGSQGRVVEKPAWGERSHCIGVRTGSRPAPMPGSEAPRILDLVRRNRHHRPCRSHRRNTRVGVPRSVSSRTAATFACSGPNPRRNARYLSWLPSTQLGQAPSGQRAASYSSTSRAMASAFHGA